LGILTGVAAVITRRFIRKMVATEGFQTTTATQEKTREQIATERREASINAARQRDAKIDKIIESDASTASNDPKKLDISKTRFIKWAVERSPSLSAEQVYEDLKNNYYERQQEYIQKAEDISANEDAALIEATKARETKIQTIIKPRPTDIFKIEFPRSFVEWAVQERPNASAEDIRKNLIEKYDEEFTKFRTRSSDMNARDAAWTADPKGKTCAEVAAAKARYLAMLNRLRVDVQDLSGNLKEAIQLKDMNRGFQQDVYSKCSRTLSDACIGLARQDEDLVTTVPWYEGVNTEIFNRQIDLTENVKVLNEVIKFIGCDAEVMLQDEELDTNTGKITDPKDLSKRLGLMNTPALRMRLSEMSPYYLSPDVLQYLTQYLINKEDVDAKVSTYATIRDDLKKASIRINEYAKN